MIASLSNLLGNHENMPEPIPKELEDYEFFDVEIKYGLLQISEGLSFLHNDVKMLHRNICPESIIVNKNGAWKIAGFDFAVSATNPTETTSAMFKFPTINLNQYSDTPPISMPNLDFVSPEFFDRESTSVGLAADIFSLGALTYALYNKGEFCHQNTTRKLNISQNYVNFVSFRKTVASNWRCGKQ